MSLTLSQWSIKCFSASPVLKCVSPVCYRKCPSGQCELRQPERLGRRSSRSRLLQSRDSTVKPEHDAARLDPHRTTCTGNTNWIHIEPHVLYVHINTRPGNCYSMSLQPIGVQLVSIQTSPNDRLLWALDNRGTVFVRTGLSDEMPVGTDWDQVPGTHLFVFC